MHKSVITFFLCTYILSFGSFAQEIKNDYTVLQGATIFDGNGKKYEKATIILKDGRIKAIGENLKIPAQAKLINVTGKFITPGRVDAHVHFFQTGFYDSRPDNGDLRDTLSYFDVQAYQRNHPERYYEAYLRSGITAVYDVGGFNWSIDLQKSAEKNLNATHVAAAGSLITPASRQRIATFNTPNENTMVHLDSEETGRNVVKENSSLGSTGIKVWGMASEDPDFRKKIEVVADEVKKQKNKLIVHATSLDQAKLALKLGAALLVHSVDDKIIDDEFIQLMKEKNTIYNPTLIVSRGYYNAMLAINGQPMIMKDPNRAVDEKTRKMIEGAAAFKKFFTNEFIENRLRRSASILAPKDSIMAINLKKLFDAGITIVVGTDAGNPGTLHGISIYDEMEAMQKAGIPANDLIIMATKNGAQAMGRLNDFGTLEIGKMADLIITSKDPSKDISNFRSITHVMRGGLLRPVNKKF